MKDACWHELAERELYAERQKALPVVYKGFHITSGASSMSFQNNLCDLSVLGGEYITAIRARRTRRATGPTAYGRR